MIEAHWPGATLTAAEPSSESRTISGTAVPWNTPGRVSTGDTVIFHPGSLDATARPPALRDHDRAKPIGKVVAARDTPAGLDATIYVSAVPDGDHALVLANDGALSMFSVGVEPTDYRFDPDGTMHVLAGDWQELSLLTIGAYPAARVATVTAQPPQEPTMIQATDTPPVEDEPDTTDEPDTETEEEAEPVQTLLPINAARGTPRRAIHQAVHPFAGVTLAGFARIVAAAKQSGDGRLLNQIVTSPGARPMFVEAALTDITLVGTNNVGAGYRPGYQAELVDIVSHGSPMVDVLRQGDLVRGDYPTKTFTQWTNLPVVDIQATEKLEVSSGPVSMAPASVDVETFATANDLSQQLLDLGSPSFVEDYIRAAGVSYAQRIDVYAVTMLMTAATNVTTVAGDDFQTVLGKLFAALDPTMVPAGGMFLGVSYDVGISLLSIKDADKPAFWDGRVNFGSFTPTADMNGLPPIIVDSNIPDRTYILGHRNAATWYDLPGTPFSLRAINVGQLGLDVGVYGYGALGVQYPGALVDTTVPLV